MIDRDRKLNSRFSEKMYWLTPRSKHCGVG